MIEFKVSIPFNCDKEKVWSIVKDLNSVPKYWQGTRELNVKEVERGVYEGKIRFAFPSSGNVKIVIDEVKKTLTFHYLDGPFKGYNIVKVEDYKITSEWKVSMNGFFKLFEGWNYRHFKEGTQRALERIVNECNKKE